MYGIATTSEPGSGYGSAPPETQVSSNDFVMFSSHAGKVLCFAADLI